MHSFKMDGIKFQYKHNPSDSPKTLLDAVEDTNAVYGYKPNRLSSYINEDGKILDIELYNQAKEHCVSYEELKNGINGKPANQIWKL